MNRLLTCEIRASAVAVELLQKRLTPSDFHFLKQNVLAGAILFSWNQYSNIVRTELSSTAF